MTDLDSLKKLVRENGYLYTKDVTSAGIRREQLKKYLDEGSLIRESRGIYSFADSINDEFVLLQSRCKKGVSLMEQLYIFMACLTVSHRWFP